MPILSMKLSGAKRGGSSTTPMATDRVLDLYPLLRFRMATTSEADVHEDLELSTSCADTRSGNDTV